MYDGESPFYVLGLPCNCKTTSFFALKLLLFSTTLGMSNLLSSIACAFVWAVVVWINPICRTEHKNPKTEIFLKSIFVFFIFEYTKGKWVVIRLFKPYLFSNQRYYEHLIVKQTGMICPL